MSRRYDTVIFDLDGTLLNTLEDLADGVNAALKHFGRPERTLDEVRQFVGNGVLNLMDRAVPERKQRIFRQSMSGLKPTMPHIQR